jgi:hypothetical protein
MKKREQVIAFLQSQRLGAVSADVVAAMPFGAKQAFDALHSVCRLGKVSFIKMPGCKARFFASDAHLESVREEVLALIEVDRLAQIEKRKRRHTELAKVRARATGRPPAKPKAQSAPKKLRQAGSSIRIEAASPKRGPAYLSGPMIFTDQTRHTIYPSKPAPLRTNTHTNWG